MTKRESIIKVKSLLNSVKRKVNLVSTGKNEIFIFGAGNTSKLYEKCFTAENISPAGFLDNDPKKHNANHDGGGYFLPRICKGVKMFSF